MILYSRSQVPSLFITVVFIFIAACSFSAVRSENTPELVLPSDQDNGGVCSQTPNPNSCPIRCFRPDPVCGVDGVTYWCGCADAQCAGTRVAKLGFCEVGSGGSGPASGQALLLVQIVWLILLGVFVLFGLL